MSMNPTGTDIQVAMGWRDRALAAEARAEAAEERVERAENERDQARECAECVPEFCNYDERANYAILAAERTVREQREALEQANLALIEARNPGIDMEAVKRQRSAALAPDTEGEG